MPAKVTYKSRRTKQRPSKSSRIMKTAASGNLPLGGTVTIKGKASDNTTKTFRFSVVSPAQQMKERNRAYRFFSID